MTHLDIAKKHQEAKVIFDKYSGDLKPKHAVCFFTDIVNEDEPRPRRTVFRIIRIIPG